MVTVEVRLEIGQDECGVRAADGLRAIKAWGGITIVQNPASAAHAGMPEAARATGCADHVLPLEDIAPTLVELAGHAA